MDILCFRHGEAITNHVNSLIYAGRHDQIPDGFFDITDDHLQRLMTYHRRMPVVSVLPTRSAESSLGPVSQRVSVAQSGDFGVGGGRNDG